MIEIDGIVYAENPLPKLIRVKYVKPLDGYKLLLTFTNGKQKIYDMSEQLGKPCFSPLKDIDLFNRAYVEYGTVVWNEDIDISPDELYYNSTSITK
ncbi:MAG: DUF2442 domain-containing protein [Oscillospiraceae bacterium]|nr:DUF2442 domain-containing protein [Oscillospiraceae bacterium]